MAVNILIAFIVAGLVGLAVYGVMLFSQAETGILIAVAIAVGTFVYAFMSL